MTNTYTLTQVAGGDPAYFIIIEGTRVAMVPIKTASEVVTFKVNEVPCHSSCGGCDLDATAKGCTSCMAGRVLVNGVCECPKGQFFDVNGDCADCLSRCSRCSTAADNCEECNEGFEIVPGTSQCLEEEKILKLKETTFHKN